MSTAGIRTPLANDGHLRSQAIKMLEFRQFNIVTADNSLVLGVRHVGPTEEQVEVRVTPAQHLLVTVYKHDQSIHDEQYVTDISGLAQMLYSTLYSA